MKEPVGEIDAIPSKRLFLSIINDYDLNRSICELIDNALDNWIPNKGKFKLVVDIRLDKDQQTIVVADNAGGVRKEDLHLIIGPGHTGNNPTDKTIGIFGVGTKRAVVALAQDIKITSRHRYDQTYSVEFDDIWLKDEEGWRMMVFRVDNIPENTTIVELTKLRSPITEERLAHLVSHLEATYAKFLSRGNLIIKVNSVPLKPVTFERWAYPPGFEPRSYSGDLKTEDGKVVKVEVIAGLTNESSPTGEYGVYLYCNDRLIERNLKTYDVGFAKGLAGKPHPTISLTRVIISLKGEAQLMPWNSSKSALSADHRVFVALRSWLVQVVKDYASLSRRLEGNWEEKVFPFTNGKIVQEKNVDFQTVRRSYLPELPKSKVRYAEKIKQVNKQLGLKKPWTVGLYESIAAVELILKQKFEQRNRIAIVLLDSTLEIALKDYLVNESGRYYTSETLTELFQRSRHHVQSEVKQYAKGIDEATWKKISFYNNMRNRLIHERAGAGISDREVRDYLVTVEEVLGQLFGLRFEDE
jgi:hypothetical protein